MLKMKFLPMALILAAVSPPQNAHAEGTMISARGYSGEYISASSGAIEGTAYGAEQDAIYKLSCEGEMTNISILRSSCSRQYGGSGNYFTSCTATASALCENSQDPNITYAKGTSGYYISASSGSSHGTPEGARYDAQSKLGSCKYRVSKVELLTNYCEFQYGGSGNFFKKCWARYMMKCEPSPSEAAAKAAMEIQSSAQMLPEVNRAQASSFDRSSMKAGAEIGTTIERGDEIKFSGAAAR